MIQMSNICRLCLSENENLYLELYQRNAAYPQFTHSQMVMECTYVQIQKSDGYSKLICVDCVKRVSDAYEFKLMCEQSEWLTFYNEPAPMTDEDVNINAIDHVKHEYIDDEIFTEEVVMAQCEQPEQFKTEVLKSELLESTVENQQTEKKVDEFVTLNSTIAEEIFFDENAEKKLNSNSLIVITMHDVNDKQKYFCKFCMKKFFSSAVLSKHVEKYHEKDMAIATAKQFIYKHAFVTDTSVDNLISKVDPTTNYQDSEGTIRKKTTTKGPCCVCNETFQTVSEYLWHRRQAHETFSCWVCSTIFPSFQLCKRHYDTKHRPKKMSQIGPFICTFCNRKFKDRSNILYHVRAHHLNERKHQCPFCEKRYILKRHLIDHEKIQHTNIRNIYCEICGEAFALNRQLRVHKMNYHSTKRYPCGQCHKSFRQPQSLSKHKKEKNHY